MNKFALLAAALTIAVIPQFATAGVIGGRKMTREVVKSRSSDYYTVSCYGGEYTRVIVAGDGDTDLDVYVYDSSGDLIKSDTDSSDKCVVYFKPYRSGRFIIKVVNRGRVYNRYAILIN